MSPAYMQEGFMLAAPAPPTDPRLAGWLDKTWPDGIVTKSRTPTSTYYTGDVVGLISSVGWRDEQGRAIEQGEGCIFAGSQCLWPRVDEDDAQAGDESPGSTERD